MGCDPILIRQGITQEERLLETVKIFIGCAANDEDLESQAVLDFTIHKLSSLPVSITWMQLTRDYKSPFYSAPEKNEGWATEKWATPFSGFRWAIPALCNYQGKGIYMDSDFIVRADIAELWKQKIVPPRAVIAKGDGRFCCSMWDCSATKEHMPSFDQLRRDPLSHSKMQRYFSVQHTRLVQPFADGDWNAVDIGLPDDLSAPKIKAIHYTRMERQLQLKHAIPRLKAEHRRHWYDGTVKPHERADLQEMFDTYLQTSLLEGYPLDKYKRNTLYGQYNIRGGR